MPSDADAVALCIARDVVRQCVQRKVRRRQGHVLEEWFIAVPFGMFLEELDSAVDNRRGRVVPTVARNSRQGLIVERMFAR